MSTVADRDVIDQVAEGDGGRLILVIRVIYAWADAPEQVEQLRGKLNAYQAWIASGQCQQQYPSAANGIDILVVCIDEPTGEAAELLLLAREGLAQRGISLYYQPALEVRADPPQD